MSLIYRGHDIIKAKDGMYEWVHEDGHFVGGYRTEEEAMTAIDTHKRQASAAAAQRHR